MIAKRGSLFSSSREQGVATLTIALILLLVATLAAFAASRSSLFEQRLSGTDVRSKEVYSAALSGLHHAVWWLQSNSPCDAGDLDVADVELNADDYTLEISVDMLTNEAYCDDPPSAQAIETYTSTATIMELVSTATAVNDQHVSKAVKVTVVRSNILAGTVNDMPPMLIEDCVEKVIGTPNIYPAEGSGTAIGTSMGGANPDCLEDLGHMETYDGHAVALDPQSTAWDAVFGSGMDKSTLKSLSQMDGSSIHYVESTNFDPGTIVSSADEPVIVFFDESSECPKIQGGTVIYGIVFYENEECAKNGWGNGSVHGSVVMTGSLDGFNSNANIFGLPDLDKSLQKILESVSLIAPVPGTWRDF